MFLFVVMSLLSSWDDMDVHVKLLADDVWAAEDDKTGSWVLEWIFLIGYIWNNGQFPDNGAD